MFEDIMAKLMDPNFAVTAAGSMDPTPLLNGLNLSANLTMPEGGQSPGSFYELLNGKPMDPMAMGPTGATPPAIGAPKPFALDAKNAQALQGMMPKNPDLTVRPPGSAGIVQPSARPSFTPLALPEMARAGQRPSLSQLIYGR